MRRWLLKLGYWLIRISDRALRLPAVYAIVQDGERVAEVTTNGLRAGARARELRAKGTKLQSREARGDRGYQPVKRLWIEDNASGRIWAPLLDERLGSA